MSAPVGYTCKHIDHVIDILTDMQKDIEYNLKALDKLYSEDEDILAEIGNLTSEIQFSLRNAEDIWLGLSCVLEELRRDNSKLRDWGDRLENDLNDERKLVANLQDEVEILKEENYDLSNN